MSLYGCQDDFLGARGTALSAGVQDNMLHVRILPCEQDVLWSRYAFIEMGRGAECKRPHSMRQSGLPVPKPASFAVIGPLMKLHSVWSPLRALSGKPA